MDNLPGQNTIQGSPLQPPANTPAPVIGTVPSDSQAPKKKTLLYIILFIALVLVAGVIGIIVIPPLGFQTQGEKISTPTQDDSSLSQPQSSSDSTYTQTVVLAGVDSGSEYGKISRDVSADKIKWRVELYPLGFEPPEGTFLQIWLASDPENSSFTPLAKPLRHDDNSYSLQIEESLVGSDTDLNQLNNFVIVSLEGVDDLSVEVIIARGEFK